VSNESTTASTISHRGSRRARRLPNRLRQDRPVPPGLQPRDLDPPYRRQHGPDAQKAAEKTAEMLGLGSAAVKTRLHRARLFLTAGNCPLISIRK